MHLKSLLAGVALVALAGPAFAVTTLNAPFGPSSLAFANGSTSATFLSGNGGILAISATNSINPSSNARFKLIDNTTSTTLFSNEFEHVYGTYASGGSDIVLIAGDRYTFEVTGYSNPSRNGFSYSATITSVPETATWAMMLAGFGALAFVGYRRRAHTA